MVQISKVPIYSAGLALQVHNLKSFEGLKRALKIRFIHICSVLMTKTQYVEWDLNNRGKSKPDSIADSDASAASSGGKWELT